MTSGLATRSAAELARATPTSRDRFLDLVRAGSIVVVVLGHYTIAAVVRNGSLHGTNALSSSGSLRLATWIFQVMPLFFFVGGVTNGFALGRPGVVTGVFFRRRVERLAAPAIVFVVAWLVAAPLMTAGGMNTATVREGARIAAQPLWFLAVYLLVIAVAPAQWRLHRRRPWTLLVVLPVLVAIVDVMRLNGVASGAADVNYLLVFVFAQELGLWYADGALTTMPRRVLIGIAAAAFTLLIVVTATGPYPVSMVGVPGEALSNMSPPTVCILLLTVGQVAVMTVLRSPLTRWLQRPRVWRVVVVANGGLLTIFLWHLTAFIVVAAVLDAAGASLPVAGSASWWMTKPMWVLGALAVLAGFVALTVRVERHALFPAGEPATGTALGFVSVVAVAAGLAALAAAGFSDLAQSRGRALVGVHASPVEGAVLLVGGYLLARWPGRLTRR